MRRSARPDRRRAGQVTAVFVGLAWAALPSSAHAEEVSAYGPLNSATVNIFSVAGPGLALEYERYLPPHFSVMTGLGFRTTGGASYSTFTLSTSLELRLWLSGHSPWSKLGERAMVGPYLGLREDVSWTIVHDDDRQRLAGTSVEVAETPAIGYRFTLWRIAVTPSLGFTLTTQMDPRGRLAPLTYPAAKLGITLGLMF